MRVVKGREGKGRLRVVLNKLTTTTTTTTDGGGGGGGGGRVLSVFCFRSEGGRRRSVFVTVFLSCRCFVLYTVLCRVPVFVVFR